MCFVKNGGLFLREKENGCWGEMNKFCYSQREVERFLVYVQFVVLYVVYIFL